MGAALVAALPWVVGAERQGVYAHLRRAKGRPYDLLIDGRDKVVQFHRGTH